MIRLFNVYIPVRTLVLLIGEALIVLASFLLGAWYGLGQDTYLVLYFENGFYKIFGVTALVLLCSHWLDLYDTARLNTKGELYFRLLMVPGVLAFILAGIAYVRPNYLLGGGSAAVGLGIVWINVETDCAQIGEGLFIGIGTVKLVVPGVVFDRIRGRGAIQ